jgi:hypothetical protein
MEEEKKEKRKKQNKIDPTKDFDLEQLEMDMGWRRSKKRYDMSEELSKLREEVNPLDKILAKSVITPDFERLEVVPPCSLSKRQLKIRKDRERRKMGEGPGWYNMHRPQLTPEVKHELEMLQMRSGLDSKRFYKKNNRQALPKHFHIGRVIDSPIEFYSSRLTKKERKKTIVDELMADAEFVKYNKRKYKEIIDERKKKTHYKAYKNAKRLKERKRK